MTATLPTSGKGDVNWRNLVDNWTHDDTVWLQDRTITRIGTGYSTGAPGDNSVYNINEGRVFYNLSTKELLVSDGTNLNPLFKSGVIKIADSTNSSELLGVSASANTGITISKTGASVSVGSAASFSSTVSITGALTVGGLLTSVKAGASGSISTDSTGFVVNTTGSNAVTITTSTAIGAATTLEVNKPVKITGALETTGSATVVNVTVNGTSTLNGNVTVSTGSTLTAPAVSVSGTTINTSGATSVAGLLTATSNLSVTDTITVAGTTPTIQSASGKNLNITVPAGSNALRLLAASGSDTYANQIYYGSTSVQNAWIVYATSDPGVANVPEGTIWIS